MRFYGWSTGDFELKSYETRNNVVQFWNDVRMHARRLLDMHNKYHGFLAISEKARDTCAFLKKPIR